MVENVIAGSCAGLLCAIGGAIKDSPHEGFKRGVFWRSPLVGALCGLATVPLTDHWLIAFGLAGYCERACVEGWKIVRCQIPGKHNWTRSEWPALWR